MKHIAISLLLLLSCHLQCLADEGIRIAWDYSSMQQIAERGGYPRLLRMQDNSLIAIYETYTGNIHYKRSYDDGMTWSAPQEVFTQFAYSNLDGESTVVNMSNPEIIQLKNGHILIACNYRPAKQEIAPYSIVIRRSADNGMTWSAPQTLYTAAPRFGDGCWEPSFLELPHGDVQVYFANENPYRQSEEQEISVLSSPDNGQTWTKTPKTVSFRKNRRDGMPVARIIKDEIVVVIEDNYIDRFKPYTVRTKLTENWNNPVLADSPNREYALTEKIADSAYLGAPYLLVLPTGETIISYQTNEGRDKNWELSTMEVAIGDRDARNFGRRSRPFDVPLNKEAKWNSLALWDENTIVAFASSNAKSKNIAPWLIKGYIIPELNITNKKVNDYPVFVGSKGNTNLRAGLGIDQKNLYIKCKIKNASSRASNQDNTVRDGIYLYILSGTNIYKIWSSHKGKIQVWKKTGDGRWESMPTKNIKTARSASKEGYEIRFDISKKIISLPDNKYIRLNVGLFAYDDIQNGYTEFVANTDENQPETWLKVKF